MGKLTEVEEAKALFTEAIDWSVVRWLREKKRVRKTADRADAALAEAANETKAQWPAEITAAYRALAENKEPAGIDADTAAFVRQIKRADDDAHRAQMESERTFAEAEKQLSTRLAREGCGKAIHQWELHEKAIRLAERFTSHTTAKAPSK